MSEELKIVLVSEGDTPESEAPKDAQGSGQATPQSPPPKREEPESSVPASQPDDAQREGKLSDEEFMRINFPGQVDADPQPIEAPDINVDGSNHRDAIRENDLSDEIVEAIDRGFDKAAGSGPDRTLSDRVTRLLEENDLLKYLDEDSDIDVDGSSRVDKDDDQSDRIVDAIDRGFERATGSGPDRTLSDTVTRFMEEKGLVPKKRNTKSNSENDADTSEDSDSRIAEKLASVLNRTSLGRRLLDSVGGKRGISSVTSAVGRLMGAGGAGGGATGSAGAAGGAAVAGGGVAATLTAVVPPALAIIAVFTGLVVAVRSLMSMYRQQADELEEFSAAITGARAAVEAEEIISKLNRAEKIGPDVAQIELARGRFNDALYDIGTEIQDSLTELTPILEAGIDYATSIVRSIEVLTNIGQLAYETSQVNFAGMRREVIDSRDSIDSFHKSVMNLFSRDDDAGGNPGVDAILNHNPFEGQPANGEANPLI